MNAGPTLALGVAGLGQAGAMLIPEVLRHGRVRLVAAADPAPGPREAAAALGIRVHASFEALCEDPRVDAIAIATPSYLHAEQAMSAFAAGKHVVVEKPMATSLDDALAMIEAAREGGRVLLVGHSHSYEPAVEAMASVRRGGELGALRLVQNLCYSDWLFRPRRPDELDTSRGGGALMRQGAHQVDILRWIAGRPARSVRAFVGRAHGARAADTLHAFFLDFEDAAATAIYSAGDHFISAELTFGLGEDGRPLADRPHAAARTRLEGGDEASMKAASAFGAKGDRPGGTGGFFGLTLASFEHGDVRQVPGGIRIYGDETIRDIALDPSVTGRSRMLDELAAAALDGVAPSHDGRWGLANLEVCLAALESSRVRREVELRYQAAAP